MTAAARLTRRPMWGRPAAVEAADADDELGVDPQKTDPAPCTVPTVSNKGSAVRSRFGKLTVWPFAYVNSIRSRSPPLPLSSFQAPSWGRQQGRPLEIRLTKSIMDRYCSYYFLSAPETI